MCYVTCFFLSVHLSCFTPTQRNFVWFSAAWLQNIAQARRTIWMTKLACFTWICICMGQRCSTKERKTGNVNYNFPFGKWYQLFNQCHWTCRYLTRVKCIGSSLALGAVQKLYYACSERGGGDDWQWLQNKSQQNGMGITTLSIW